MEVTEVARNLRQGTLQYTTGALIRDRFTDTDLLQLATESDDVTDDTTLDTAIDIVDEVATVDESTQKAAVKVAQIIKKALVHGEGRVNSYVGVVYDLPAYAEDGTVPPEIEDAVLVLAEAQIRNRRKTRRRSATGDSDMDKAIKETMRWLKSVSQGKAIVAKLDQTTEKQEKRRSSSFGYGSNAKFSTSW